MDKLDKKIVESFSQVEMNEGSEMRFLKKLDESKKRKLLIKRVSISIAASLILAINIFIIDSNDDKEIENPVLSTLIEYSDMQMYNMRDDILTIAIGKVDDKELGRLNDEVTYMITEYESIKSLKSEIGENEYSDLIYRTVKSSKRIGDKIINQLIN